MGKIGGLHGSVPELIRERLMGSVLKMIREGLTDPLRCAKTNRRGIRKLCDALPNRGEHGGNCGIIHETIRPHGAVPEVMGEELVSSIIPVRERASGSLHRARADQTD